MYPIKSVNNYEGTSEFIKKIIALIDKNKDGKIQNEELQASYNKPELSHIFSRMVCKHKSEWSYKWAKIKSDYEKFIKYHYPKAKQEYVDERLDEIQAKYDALYDFWDRLEFKTDIFWYFEPFAWVEQMKRVFSVLKWHDPVDNPRLTKYGYSGNVKPSSATYGWCRRNPDKSKKFHSGLDLFAIPGKDQVYACLKGNICQVKYSDSAGWIIRVKIQNVEDLLEQERQVSYETQFSDELKGIDIKETDNVYFVYMHLQSVFFASEDAKNKTVVEAGTPLGYAGVSGSIASGGKAPHLHLEVTTVLDAYGKGESARTNPARFIKLNSYNTQDQDDAAKTKYYHKK